MRLLIFFAFSVLAFAQTQAGRFQLQQGTSLPGTCSTGEVFFKSNEAAGQNVYGCISGTWTLQAGGGAGYDPFSLTKMQGADEFCHPINDYPTGNTTGLGELHVKVVNASGTGAINGSSNLTAQYPCGFLFSTGNSAANESYLIPGGLGAMLGDARTGIYEWVFDVPTITDVKVSVNIGRRDTSYPPCWDTGASHACFAVTFDTSQSDTTWKIRECDNLSTGCSTTDTAMTVVAGRKYRVRLNKATATTAIATIVDQSDGTTYTSGSISWTPPSGTYYTTTFRLHAVSTARTADMHRLAYDLSPATRY